jgi:uncharacterized protein (TIGR02117 family)
MMRVRKWLIRVVGALIGAAVVYGGVALVLGAIPVNRDFRPATEGTEIAVCSNGIHTDFVLPVKTSTIDWQTQFPQGDFTIPLEVFDHVGIGWGDLDFYRTTPTWNDFSVATALHAVAGLGPAALHVQYRPAPGPTADCRGLRLDEAHYRALTDYILGSRVTGPAVTGYGGSDAFYPANGRFSLFKSCNVWVGQGLRASGLPTGLWTPFSFQVLSHL